MAKIIDSYARMVARRPVLILILSLILTTIMVYGLTNLELTNTDFEGSLPDNLEVVKSIDLIRNEFGGTENALIVIQIDSSTPGSTEPIDVRDSRIIRYIDILTQGSEHIDYVEGVSSISNIIKELNNGRIPNSLNSIKILLKDNLFASNYVSEDNSMSLVRISLNEDVKNDAEEFERQLSELIEKTEKPAGVSVQIAGEVIRNPVIERVIGPDMSRTSLFSLIGILIVLLFLLRSIKFGLLALTTILFGIVWALGFVALIGLGISTASAGVVSMIMGIGIDFGIQIITRFRHELKTHDKIKAMEVTISSVFMPMITTTLAALIGFRAMSLGQLTIMSEMGTIMSFGVAASMLAAITIVPSMLVLLEKDK